MQLTNWLPWNWGKQEVGVRRDDGDRVQSLQSDINRAFDDFWRAFGPLSLPQPPEGAVGDRAARLEIAEADDEVEVSIELAGMSEEDIEVTLGNDVLTVRGERKEERADKRKDYHVQEWSYGSVRRSVSLPPGLDLDGAEATFKNGILTVRLPKSDEARRRVRKISVS